jgi:hypothetical protein
MSIHFRKGKERKERNGKKGTERKERKVRTSGPLSTIIITEPSIFSKKLTLLVIWYITHTVRVINQNKISAVPREYAIAAL